MSPRRRLVTRRRAVRRLVARTAPGPARAHGRARASFPTPSLELAEAIAVLERTPRLLRTMLGGLPRRWTEATEGPRTWSPRGVMGHLVHGEDADWIPRARIILEQGEARPFTPYDRFAQFRLYRNTPMPALLAMFERKRTRNLRTLRAWRLTRRQLRLTGIHPEFGRVSLGQLLATWVAHDLTHVVQVGRVMAKRYRTDVGPWVRYLSVLTRH